MVFTAGCEDDDDGHPPPPAMSRGRIYADTDEFVWEMGSGELHWDDYQVIVRDGNDTITLKTEEGKTTKYGDEAFFKDPLGSWDPILGEEYNIKVVNLIENKVVWEDDIFAQ